MSANKVNTARNERALAQLFEPSIRVSSANCKCDTPTELDVPTEYHVNKLLLTAEFIITFNPSAAIRNKKGERGSP